MDVQTGWLTIAAVIAIVLLAGCSTVNAPNNAKTEKQVTVKACDSLPEYDYERMVERVEEIKGKKLKRNLSICIEQSSDGIDTTPGQRQFASLREPGLSFFGLGQTTNSARRSSLAHMRFSPSGGPVRIFLTDKTVVENISRISYEGIVAHELSHAIETPESIPQNTTTSRRTNEQPTTDEILAQQALSNGVSTYVADLYVQEYGGHVNVSASTDYRNWKHQLVRSVYYWGYYYSQKTDRRTLSKEDGLNSTAQILHPNETRHVTGFPARPNLSMSSLEHVRTDRVGELFIRETLENRGVSSERAVTAADGWTNDRLDYYRTDDSTVVTWRVTWQNTDEKEEFAKTYDEVYDYQQVESLSSIRCREHGRYLTTTEKSLTIMACDVKQQSV